VNEVILSVAALTVRRGARTILDRVGFDVHRGEILGVIGPNGAGKTTLFECMAGLQPFDEGTVKPETRGARTLYYVPDAIRPWPDQTVRWTLDLCARAAGTMPVELFDLARLAPQRVASLSKGETKRLNLAIGLTTREPILLLDEPFDGLDLRQTRAAMDELRRVADGGRTLVLSIHQLNDAARICDRLLLLNNGRLVAIGTVAELQAQTGLAAAGIEEIFLALT
jgi:ABC-2 type transport system ATP-binding protein